MGKAGVGRTPEDVIVEVMAGGSFSHHYWGSVACIFHISAKLISDFRRCSSKLSFPPQWRNGWYVGVLKVVEVYAQSRDLAF